MKPTHPIDRVGPAPDGLRTAGVILTAADIAELQAIYRRKYREDLSDDEAWELGNRLIRVFAVLTRDPAVRTPSHLPSTGVQL